MLSLLVVAGFGYWALTVVGNWLVTADPLQHARAIVVLSGGVPFRAMGAADLYDKGWAPEVWITSAQDRAVTEAFERLTIPYTSDREYSQRVLEKLGVPAESIRVLPAAIHNTAEEIRAITATLGQVGGDSVIIVTSPPHTRRVKTLWRILGSERQRLIVRYDSYEPYEPHGWWRNTEQGDDVVHEILGLINARLGFVAQPRH